MKSVKKLFLSTIVFLGLCMPYLFVACSNSGSSSTNNSGSTQTQEITYQVENYFLKSTDYNSTSGVWTVVTTNGNTDQTFTVTSSLGADASQSDVTVADDSTITIVSVSASNQEYTLSGTLYGSIVVDYSSEIDLTINLQACTITSYSTAPIYVKNSGDVDISAKTASSGAQNYIYDYRSSADDTLDAAIYSKNDLKLKGSGYLTIVSAKNRGVHTKDDLTIQKQTLTVTSYDQALKGNDGVSIVSGTISLSALHGDGIKTSTGSFKKNSTTERKGTVKISGGTITINSLSDGIDAVNNIEISGGSLTITTSGNLTNSSSTSYVSSAKGIKANNQAVITGGTITITSTDDGIHADYGNLINEDYVDDGESAAYGTGTIDIFGGTLSVSSGDDGIHADNTLNISDSATVKITKSTEGLEANFLNISGGTTTIYATDDGVNASKKIGLTPVITISGGYLDITVSSGDTDGVDSNGSYVQTGGVVITRGPAQSNSTMASLDTDGSVQITGGTLIALGSLGSNISKGTGVYSKTFGTSSGGGMGGGFGGFGGPSNQNNHNGTSSSYSFGSGSYSIELNSQTLEFTLSNTFTFLAIYSDDLTVGNTYSIVKNSSTLYSWTQSNS